MFEDRQYQLDAVEYALRDTDRPILCSPTGCHSAGTKVVMYDGSLTAVENIPVGARLMGPDGSPREVLRLCRGQGAMYRITPLRGGDPFVVNEDHVLSLKRTNEGKGSRFGGSVDNVTVRDYLAESRWFRHVRKLYRPAALDFSDEYKRADLPIDPWVMGVILGDGGITAGSVTVSSADPEILAAIEANCQDIRCVVRRVVNGSSTMALTSGRGPHANPVLDALRQVGLMGRGSGTKFIPPTYRFSDRSSRLALLAGLIDSDGHYSANGEYDIYQKSRSLVEQTAFVARSLGFAVSPLRCRIVNGTDYWRISINGDLHTIPVVTPRKRARPRRINKSHLVTGFTIEPIGKGDYYGFNLDGDHLYLLEDFTVTHNSGKSYICALIAKHTIADGKCFGILTPREEILTQMAHTMGEVCGFENVGILKSGQHWNRMRPVQVVSWPTLLARTAKSEAWFPDLHTLAIDECHLALSPKMAERVLPYYDGRAKIVGVTATPARKSGRGLGSFFTHIKHVTTVRQLIKEGKLTPLEYWGGSFADVSGVGSSNGDYNSKQLSDASMPLVGDVIDNWARLASDRHTLVFAADVAHCEALTERFQQAGVAAASLHIHKTPERRRQIVEAFKARRIQVLVNVSIASYGFDAPTVDCLVMARRTKSIVLHLQMLGRGMRIAEGKTECMVLDHANNVRSLGQADDLFRWRLNEGRKAAANWTRDERSKDAKKGDDKTHQCEECQYIFSRSLVCPKCGWEIPLPKRDRAAIDADLVRISEQKHNGMPEGWPKERDFYLMLLWIARDRGHSDKWAYFSYCEFAAERSGLQPTRPPLQWKELTPIVPSIRVRNWVTKRKKAYARKQAKNAA